jgi:hypothetical protein
VANTLLVCGLSSTLKKKLFRKVIYIMYIILCWGFFFNSLMYIFITKNKYFYLKSKDTLRGLRFSIWLKNFLLKLNSG